MDTYMHAYIYIYICMHVCTDTFVHIKAPGHRKYLCPEQSPPTPNCYKTNGSRLCVRWPDVGGSTGLSSITSCNERQSSRKEVRHLARLKHEAQGFIVTHLAPLEGGAKRGRKRAAPRQPRQDGCPLRCLTGGCLKS